jgi:hypothetical protein
MEAVMTADKPGWWKRNWKWFVPVGCLSIILLCGGGGVALVTGIMGMMKSSDAYQMALEQVRADKDVTTQLGQPVETGWWVQGNIQVSGSGGHAEMSFPISGPKGKGTASVEAIKEGGKWKLTRLVVGLDGRPGTLVLVGKKQGPEAGAP